MQHVLVHAIPLSCFESCKFHRLALSLKQRVSIVVAVVVLQHVMGRSHTAVTCNHLLRLLLLLLMRHHLLLQDLLLVLVLVLVRHHARLENLTVQSGGRMVAICKNLLLLIELLLVLL